MSVYHSEKEMHILGPVDMNSKLRTILNGVNLTQILLKTENF
jgi:hypothetical protein